MYGMIRAIALGTGVAGRGMGGGFMIKAHLWMQYWVVAGGMGAGAGDISAIVGAFVGAYGCWCRPYGCWCGQCACCCGRYGRYCGRGTGIVVGALSAIADPISERARAAQCQAIIDNSPSNYRSSITT